jgi:hypothetical protein
MHAAGAAGAAVAITDCTAHSATPLYGAACVESCQAADAGTDAADASDAADAGKEASDDGASDATGDGGGGE